MNDPDTLDPVEFVRKEVRSALRGISYHKGVLPNCYRNLAFAKELLTRCNVDEDTSRVDDVDNDVFENMEQLACSILDHWEWDIEYHEKALNKSYNQLAMLEILIARGHYTEIDIKAMRREPKADE